MFSLFKSGSLAERWPAILNAHEYLSDVKTPEDRAKFYSDKFLSIAAKELLPDSKYSPLNLQTAAKVAEIMHLHEPSLRPEGRNGNAATASLMSRLCRLRAHAELESSESGGIRVIKTTGNYL